MRRIKLRQLPDELAEVIEAGRELIGPRADDLLPHDPLDFDW